MEGNAKAQAIEINKSLSALGRVVKALGAGQSHVPYRDSTLTRLLRNSFGVRTDAASPCTCMHAPVRTLIPTPHTLGEGIDHRGRVCCGVQAARGGDHKKPRVREAAGWREMPDGRS